MNAGDDAAELACQHRAAFANSSSRQNLRAMVSPSMRCHDEAGAEFVVRRQHMNDARRWQPGVMREPHQRGLGIEPGSPARRRAVSRRRASQDRADVAVGCTMSNDQVSWLAPPESFAAPVTPVAPAYQAVTQRPS